MYLQQFKHLFGSGFNTTQSLELLSVLNDVYPHRNPQLLYIPRPATNSIYELLVGSLLGDAWSERHSPTSNCRIGFKQSGHSWKLEHIRNIKSILADAKLCNDIPLIPKPSKQHGFAHLRYTNQLYSVTFKTFTTKEFLFLHEGFYPGPLHKGMSKVIPPFIGEYLSPLGLATLIADDGHWARTYFTFCLECFDDADLVYFCYVINILYDLDAYLQKRLPKKDSNGNVIEGEFTHRVCIPVHKIEKLRSIVLPYLVPGMRFRVGVTHKEGFIRV